MRNKKFKKYVIDTISLLKKQALEAKKDADDPKETLWDYANGVLMGYYSIINLLKHQAFVFCIDQKVLGLADIEPDTDLLGLHRNPDIDFGEDNWAIDNMREEQIKGYLSDTVQLLKEQAREAKKDVDNPRNHSEDYSKGEMMAYHTAIKCMKGQTSIFNIDLKQNLF